MTILFGFAGNRLLLVEAVITFAFHFLVVEVALASVLSVGRQCNR